jgi:hypothetical protein
MAFYFLFFLLIALQPPDPAIRNSMAALAGVYGLAFFSLVAGYFWARWYAIGVGIFGFIVAVMLLWQVDPDLRPLILNQLLFFGGTHVGASLMLWGDAMSMGYDGQTAWREKFHMDDNAVQRLGRAVIRAGVSLPFVLLYAFTPRPDSSLLAGIVALCLTGLGIRALIKLKTWGVLALAAAGVLLTAIAGTNMAQGDVFLSVGLPGLGRVLPAAAVPFSNR